MDRLANRLAIEAHDVFDEPGAFVAQAACAAVGLVRGEPAASPPTLAGVLFLTHEDEILPGQVARGIYRELIPSALGMEPLESSVNGG